MSAFFVTQCRGSFVRYGTGRGQEGGQTRLDGGGCEFRRQLAQSDRASTVVSPSTGRAGQPLICVKGPSVSQASCYLAHTVNDNVLYHS